MFYYSISKGEYSDYREVYLLHEKLFTKKEFQSMCKQSLIGDKYGDFPNINYTIDEICKNYNFKIIKRMNCHLYDYTLPDESICVIEGLEERIQLKEIGKKYRKD